MPDLKLDFIFKVHTLSRGDADIQIVIEQSCAESFINSQNNLFTIYEVFVSPYANFLHICIGKHRYVFFIFYTNCNYILFSIPFFFPLNIYPSSYFVSGAHGALYL